MRFLIQKWSRSCALTAHWIRKRSAGKSQQFLLCCQRKITRSILWYLCFYSSSIGKCSWSLMSVGENFQTGWWCLRMKLELSQRSSPWKWCSPQAVPDGSAWFLSFRALHSWRRIMEKKVPALSSITVRTFCLEALHPTQKVRKSYQKHWETEPFCLVPFPEEKMIPARACRWWAGR